MASSQRAAAGTAPEPPGRGGGAWVLPGPPARPAPSPRAGAQVSGPGAAADALPSRLSHRRPLRARRSLLASSAQTSACRLSGRTASLLARREGGPSAIRRRPRLPRRSRSTGRLAGALGQATSGRRAEVENPGRETEPRWGRVVLTGRARS